MQLQIKKLSKALILLLKLWQLFISLRLLIKKIFNSIFIVYITIFSLDLILIYLVYKTQVIILLTKKTIIIIKYLDFINIFLKKLVTELAQYQNIKKYTINL